MIRALALVVALSSAAVADNKSEAVALFNEGIKEMKAGNFDKACPAFAKSNELHPDSGTRGSLAKCYEKIGKLASAWRLWVDLSSTAPEKLRPDAAANAAKLEPRVPKYVLRISKGAAKLEVKLDGQVIPWKPDVPEPIDPGEHVFAANAPGYVGIERVLTAVEGKTEEIAIALEPTTKTVVDPARQDVPPPPPPKSERTTLGKVGFWMMGGGGALLVAGGVFGYLAMSERDDAKDLCGGDLDQCDPLRVDEAQDKIDSARSKGTISTIGVIAGAVTIGVGLVLFTTGKTKQETRVTIAPTDGGAAVTFGGGF
jgi:hypothetical protein